MILRSWAQRDSSEYVWNFQDKTSNNPHGCANPTQIVYLICEDKQT